MRSTLGILGSAIRNSSPVPYSARRGFSVFGGSSGNRASLLRQYGSVGTLFAIVHGSANAVGLVDWSLYNKRVRASQTANQGDRQPVKSHLALDVLNTPNAFMSGQELFETTQQHIDLVGEGYWVIVSDERMPGIPQEIWPIRPDRMEPVPHPTDFLSGWLYKGPDGENIPLTTDEVIQYKMPNPTDPYRGMGAVQSVLYDLDSSRYGAEYNRNFFINSAEPGGVVEVPESLDDDEFKQLRDRWAEQHRGVAQAHRVAILEGGAKWVDRSFTMRDMQFAQLREVSREFIREAFAYPKPMLGTVEDVNRANAEAAEYIFARWFLNPRLERFKGKLNSQYLPLFGNTSKNLEFDYESVVPEDKEAQNSERDSRVSAFQTLIEAQVDPKSAAEIAGIPEPVMRAPEPEPAGV